MICPETSSPPRRTSQAQQLVECAGVSLLASPEGIAYAQISLGSAAAQSVALRSSRFRDWLLARYCQEYGIVPAVNAVNQSMRMFEANAHSAQDQNSHTSPFQTTNRPLDNQEETAGYSY